MFLEYFGLRGLNELPDAEELRHVPITKPGVPVTTGDDDEDAPEKMSLEEVTAPRDNEGELVDDSDDDEMTEKASKTT